VESGFKILDLTDLSVEATDVAYADDVVSMTSSPEALQKKADIMSGWSLLSGVNINAKKLRTFGVSWGPNRYNCSHLKIHGEGWNQILVDINPDGLLTQLGCLEHGPKQRQAA
jgi:hypothetical protein